MQKYIFFLISFFCLNNSLICSCCGSKSVEERTSQIYQLFKNQSVQNHFQVYEVGERVDLTGEEFDEYLELFERFHEIERFLLIKELNQWRRMFKKYFWTIVKHYKFAHQAQEQHENIFESFQNIAWILHMQQRLADDQVKFYEMEDRFNPDSEPVSPREVPKVHFSLSKTVTPCSSRQASRHPSPCPSTQVTPSKKPFTERNLNCLDVASVPVPNWEN